MEKNKKLVFFGDASSVHTLRWIEILVKYASYDLHLISFNSCGDHKYPSCVKIYKIGNIRVTNKRTNWEYLLKILSFRQLLKKISPDIVCTIYLNSYGFIASLLKKKFTLCHIIIGSDLMIFPDKSPIHKAVVTFSLKKADIVVSSSETLSRKAKNLVRGINILTQQYGIDADLRLLRTDEKRYLFASNRQWISNSNIPYIFEILGGIKSSKKSIFIGTPQLQLQEYQDRYGDLFDFKTWISPEENYGIIASSIFFVSLTTSDGAPLSLLEAMYMGAIPVLSDIAPNREWVEHEKNGYLVPLNNIEVAISIFKEASNLPESRIKEIQEINYQIVEERGLAKVNAKRFLNRLELLD